MNTKTMNLAILNISLFFFNSWAYENTYLRTRRSKLQKHISSSTRQNESNSITDTDDVIQTLQRKSKCGKAKSSKKLCQCKVKVTNLSYKQAFGEMFVMLHSNIITNKLPIYELGQSPTRELCEITQNLNATGLKTLYSDVAGVDKTWITSEYSKYSDGSSKYLAGGDSFEFMVDPNPNYISIAAGFPFANDGGFVLQSAKISNRVEYYVPAIDSGCEANLQTRWSVPGKQADFQGFATRSDCANYSGSDTNNNDIGGENFVSIHRGMIDIDGKDEWEQLALLECEDTSIDHQDNYAFAKYFRTVGYKDKFLLCATVDSNGVCNLRTNSDVLHVINVFDDFAGSDSMLIRAARDAADFGVFCDHIEDVNKDLESAFKVLEPNLFDFRNPIARVSIEC